MRFAGLYFIVLLALALACGGGGGGEDGSGSSQSSLKIELINDTTKSKLVALSEDSPFRIFSDQTNRTDPTEATHARVNVYDSIGQFISSTEKKLVRGTTAPYDVDPDSRFVNISNPPSGNITIEVELGQDFGVTSSNTRAEVIYYSGSVNVFLSGNVAIIDGQESTTIPVIIKNVVDEGSGLYSIQGYLDFVDYPIVVDEQDIDELFNTDLSLSITTLTGVDHDFESPDNSSIGNTSYIANNIKLDELDQPLSYFFEVLNISANFTGFFVAAETGSPVNYVLRGYIPPSESSLSLPVLIDWETTWAKIMTDWYLYATTNDDDHFISDSYEVNYNAMSNVFVNIQDLFLPSSSGNTYSDPYVLNAQDLLLAEITYSTFRTLNFGDKLSDTSTASRFDVKVVQGAYEAVQGVGYFFFTGDNTSNLTRSLRVNLEYSSDTLDVPDNPLQNILLDDDRQPILDSSGNLTILESPEPDDIILVDEYQSSVMDISFNKNSLVEYLYSLMRAEINYEKP